jgi:hypothetical protein
MKKILKTTIFAFLLISLGSCTNEKSPVARANGLNLQPITPSGPFVLSPLAGDNDVTTIAWDVADKGVATSESTYVIEIEKSGTNFAKPIIASPIATSTAFLWKESFLNTLLLENGFLADVAADIDVRIKSTLGLEYNPLIQYSNILTIKVTPFSQSAFAFAKVGDDPANAPKMISSSLYASDCEGYAWLEAGDYKFFTSVGGVFKSTNTFYGDNGSGALVLNGAAVNVATAGFYMLKANLGTSPTTYSVTASEWGIFGLAKPNPTGVNKKMIYNTVSKKWELTVILNGGKAFKFRNTGSTLILGGFDETKVDINYAGTTMSYLGKDIYLAGTTQVTYLVTLDLNTPRAYTYTLVKQ